MITETTKLKKQERILLTNNAEGSNSITVELFKCEGSCMFDVLHYTSLLVLDTRKFNSEGTVSTVKKSGELPSECSILCYGSNTND
jgi:hypothetical protein